MHKQRIFTTAFTAILLGGFGMAPAVALDTITIGGKEYTVTVKADGTLVGTPVAPPVVLPPVGVTVTATGAGSVLVSWRKNDDGTERLKNVTVGRDGKDSNGSGAWTSGQGVGQPFQLTNLIPGNTYQITVSGVLVVGGGTVTETKSYTVPTGSGTPPTSPPTTTPTDPPTTTPTSPVGGPDAPKGLALSTGKLPWISGMSGPGVASGAAGKWRGLDVPLAATWADSGGADSQFWSLDGEYRNWAGSLDVACGFCGFSGSWSDAASGKADSAWRASLTTLKSKWDKLPHATGATLFIRFTHEANAGGGNQWYGWAWDKASPSDVKKAWGRFDSVVNDVFGASNSNVQLVFSLNKNSVSLGRAWTDFYPTDVKPILDADIYDSGTAWADEVNSVDQYGAPIGMNAYLKKAADYGVPFMVSEWSGRFNEHGDDTSWFQGFYDTAQAAKHGWAPGAFLAEVQYSDTISNLNFSVYANGGTSKGPKSAALYRQLW